MAGNKTHRERIERLEAQFETIERGITRVNRLERMMERWLRRHPRMGSDESSVDETSESSESFDDL